MPEVLDPKSILLGDRQRREVGTLDPNFVQSVARRLIHPIVIRRSDEGLVLVAGGRRLAALIAAEVLELHENIHFRYMDDLGPEEAKIVELEENVKRADLPWRDHARAVGELYAIYSKQGWNFAKTADDLNVSEQTIRNIVMVSRNLDSPLLRDATGLNNAYSILQAAAEHRAAAIINDIANVGSQIFTPPPETPDDAQVPNLNGSNAPLVDAQDSGSPDSPSSPNPPLGHQISPPILSANLQALGPIIQASFLDWAPQYSGPKFNLIHCDFPFGIGVFQGQGMKPNSLGALDYEDEPDSEVYWNLLDCLCENLDRLASYQSHILFWFSMNHFEETKKRLSAAGLMVLNHPLIWHKSDGKGMIPGRGNHPRRVYETAFLCSLGQRPLGKKFSNCYSGPTADRPIHPSQKPEPVLRYFFSGLVDETTDLLDPTCGSGSAIRAAEDLGARSALGLELSPEYAESARVATLNARVLREATR